MNDQQTLKNLLVLIVNSYKSLTGDWRRETREEMRQLRDIRQEIGDGR